MHSWDSKLQFLRDTPLLGLTLFLQNRASPHCIWCPLSQKTDPHLHRAQNLWCGPVKSSDQVIHLCMCLGPLVMKGCLLVPAALLSLEEQYTLFQMHSRRGNILPQLDPGNPYTSCALPGQCPSPVLKKPDSSYSSLSSCRLGWFSFCLNPSLHALNPSLPLFHSTSFSLPQFSSPVPVSLQLWRSFSQSSGQFPGCFK